MKIARDIQLYICIFMFISLNLNKIYAQKKELYFSPNEIDSLEGFSDVNAKKKQSALGIPEQYTEDFLDIERSEFINKKYNFTTESKKAKSKPVYQSSNGSNSTCSSISVSPICTTTNHNLDFELGTTTNWYGATAAVSKWMPAYTLGTMPSFSAYLFNNVIQNGRQTIVSNKVIRDPYGKFPIVNPDGGGYSLKLGNDGAGAESDHIYRKFVYDSDHPYLIFRYAIVMEDPGHDELNQPYFEALLFDKSCSAIPCATLVSVAKPSLPGFKKFQSGIYQNKFSVGGYYKSWTYSIIDISKLGASYTTGDEFIISFKTADCGYGGHFGYAYVEMGCDESALISITGRFCKNKKLEFVAPSGNSGSETYSWTLLKFNSTSTSYENITPNTGLNSSIFQNKFLEKGLYKIRLNYDLNVPAVSGAVCSTGVQVERSFEILDCEDDIVGLSDCIKSFSPIVNETYSFDAWVREDEIPFSAKKYAGPGVQFLFNGTGQQTVVYKADGPIIDGWQRVSGDFIVPAGTGDLEIKLLNTNSDESKVVYFDDLRIYPTKGMVKTFVYDPITKQLSAQLDENNFATFYEYNQEGNAVRVKVETEKGVFTVKEQGSFLKRK